MSTSEESLKETGRSAAAAIVEMVAALECDYDRLDELKALRDDLRAEFDAEPANAGVDFMHWARNQHSMTSEDVDELIELESAAGECKDREEAETRIQEDALSVEVRSPWYTPVNDRSDIPDPEEFMILLTTGGPAVRIMGELDEHGQPDRAWLEVQDWGTPWTRYFDISQDTLLAYARCFYFGEG